MFPERILQEMFGVEYFIQVLPERELETSLLAVEGEWRALNPGVRMD
jgi:hypothetical protein